MWPNLGFCCGESIVCSLLTTCPYFDNLELDICDVAGLQCHFIMSVAIAVRIQMLSVHWHKVS